MRPACAAREERSSGMKEVHVVMYECDWCGQQFASRGEAAEHERRRHKCPACKHSWYLYGSELMCDLEKCSFRPKQGQGGDGDGK